MGSGLYGVLPKCFKRQRTWIPASAGMTKTLEKPSNVILRLDRGIKINDPIYSMVD